MTPENPGFSFGGSMNEEKEPIQEMGTQVAHAEATPQEGVAQQGEASPKQEPSQDLTQEVERLRKELERVRKEAAERRVRLAELERAWKQAQERAMLAEARVVLSAKLGDPVAAEAALKLARADGLLREVKDGVEVDVDVLLQRYPILRKTSAPQDSGANPAGVSLRSLEDLASMSPEEINRNWELIRNALRK